jgi:hypothetical protein
MENSFAFTFDNFRADHEAALSLEQAKLADVAEKLKKKEK